jgi:hypothetical protein
MHRAVWGTDAQPAMRSKNIMQAMRRTARSGSKVLKGTSTISFLDVRLSHTQPLCAGCVRGRNKCRWRRFRRYIVGTASEQPRTSAKAEPSEPTSAGARGKHWKQRS